MKLVKQTQHDKLCGQCCVAMVLGISLHHAIELVGHKNGTRSNDLIQAIKKESTDYHPDFWRYSKRYTFKNEVAILMVRPLADKDHRHWVVCNKGKILCPATGRFKSIEEYLGNTWKITSVIFMN